MYIYGSEIRKEDRTYLWTREIELGEDSIILENAFPDTLVKFQKCISLLRLLVFIFVIGAFDFVIRKRTLYGPTQL